MSGSVPAPPKPSRPRDYRLDFFRGVSLLLIFIDHIPDNILGWLTLPSIAFSDAAEIFIFISGFAAAMVYSRGLAGPNWLFSAARIYKRVWQLYVAHLFLFMVYNAEVSFTVQRFNNPMYNDELHVADFLKMPDLAVINALTLQFQPTFLDILPLYIALLAVFPLVLAGLQRATFVVLLLSGALYASVQIWQFNAPGFPEGSTWFFDPFAWQFLFIVGAAFGQAQAAGRHLLPRHRAMVWSAAIIAGGFAIIRLSWTLHGAWDDVPGLFLRELWPVDKTMLAPIRLVNFAALAVLVSSLIRPDSAWLRSRYAWPVVICGQNSLEVFCCSILLALLGHFIMVEISNGFWVQIAMNLGGFLIMFALAYLLSWFGNGGRLPSRHDAVAMTEQVRQ